MLVFTGMVLDLYSIYGYGRAGIGSIVYLTTCMDYSMRIHSKFEHQPYENQVSLQ